MMFAVFLVVIALLCVDGHIQPGVVSKVPCSEHPPAQSYHIHVLFWQNNKNSTNEAIQLQESFLSKFGLTYEKDTCPFSPGDIQPNAPMCVFSTDFAPAGQFVTAQTALFVPVADYERSISWLVPRRGNLDVFIHPNSGCSINDHLKDALWAGNRWELDPSIFLD